MCTNKYCLMWHLKISIVILLYTSLTIKKRLPFNVHLFQTKDIINLVWFTGRNSVNIMIKYPNLFGWKNCRCKMDRPDLWLHGLTSEERRSFVCMEDAQMFHPLICEILHGRNRSLSYRSPSVFIGTLLSMNYCEKS